MKLLIGNTGLIGTTLKDSIKFDYEFNGENKLGDPLNWCADIYILKGWGYKKIFLIEDGIKDYINWVTCS